MKPLPRRWAWVPALLTLALMLVLWQLFSRYGPWPSVLFPPPRDVASSTARLFADGHLWPSLWRTLQRLFLGFVLSMGIGLVAAFVMERFRVVRAGLKPFLLGFQSLPSIAWVPLAILWFGYDESALIFVTVIGSVFAVALAFTDALAGVPVAYIWAARNMGSRGMNLILRVSIPAVMPGMISGAKQCWSFAWRSLVGAEIIFASVGLGFLINQGREFLDVGQVFAVMLATLFVGLLFEVIVFAGLERWIRVRWGLATAD